MELERDKKKILLIGDSIRMGYDKYVRMAFEEIAKVYYPDENCRFAAYVLRYLHIWKDNLQCGDDVDCVHWNAGLWDTLSMPDGELHTPVDIYKYYIDRVCKRIKAVFPKAKVIFATSTPVREELFLGECKRYNKDIELYNSVASEIAKSYGFFINDLYEVTKNVPVSYYSDMTHFYTKEGTQLISDKVIRCIEEHLDIRGKMLDYYALFSDTTEAVGM